MKNNEKYENIKYSRRNIKTIENTDNKPIGMINWFGVHCTSISNDNHKINSDNKGYAAAYFENEIKSKLPNHKFIGIFAQEASGDISPCYIWDKKKKWMRGKFEDDYKSAKHNGKLQMDKALEIFDNAANKDPLSNAKQETKDLGTITKDVF